MEKIKKICYLFYVFLPILIIVLLSGIISKYITFIDFEYYFTKTRFSEFQINHPRRIAFVISVLFFWVILIIINRKLQKEFAPKNMYGNYPFVFYYLALILLGYKKVDLKMKPIPLQFKLLEANTFDYYDSSTWSEEKFKYDVIYKRKINNHTKRINIVVSDTYDIDLSKLPNTENQNPTIVIKRKGKSGIRTFSQELIDIIHSEVESSKKYCKEYHLFLSTPGKTNQEIFQQIFQTGNRDGFTIYVYQQDNNNDFNFKSKPTKIRC